MDSSQLDDPYADADQDGVQPIYATSSPTGRSRYRLTADYVRVTGGELRAVRRANGDSLLFGHPTGDARITAFVDSGGKLRAHRDARRKDFS